MTTFEEDCKNFSISITTQKDICGNIFISKKDIIILLLKIESLFVKHCEPQYKKVITHVIASIRTYIELR